MIAAIGFCNTGVAMNSIEIFQRSKTPLIVPCATGTPVTSIFHPAESYIFRNAPRDAIQAPFIVDELIARNWTKVAGALMPRASSRSRATSGAPHSSQASRASSTGGGCLSQWPRRRPTMPPICWRMRF